MPWDMRHLGQELGSWVIPGVGSSRKARGSHVRTANGRAEASLTSHVSRSASERTLEGERPGVVYICVWLVITYGSYTHTRVVVIYSVV